NIIDKSFQIFAWLVPRGVDSVSGSIEDCLVSIHDECRRNGQLPAFISISKRQIDERVAVNFLLILWNAVHKAEPPRNLVSPIAQQGKAQFMLVGHEK